MGMVYLEIMKKLQSGFKKQRIRAMVVRCIIWELAIFWGMVLERTEVLLIVY